MTTDEIKALTQRLRHYGDLDRDAACALIESQAVQLRAAQTIIAGMDQRNVHQGREVGALMQKAADVQGERDANAILTAEVESLRADIAHKDAYAEQLGRELAKAGARLENWKAAVWAIARELNCLPSTFSDGNGHVLKAAIKLNAELAELKDAARINLENYEFQRNKADKATAGLYSVHYALKDVGWHPGRTDDLLSDIIKARGAEANADATRLDYLQTKLATVSLCPDGRDDTGTRFAFMVGGWHCSVSRDVRAAIDAAISAAAA